MNYIEKYHKFLLVRRLQPNSIKAYLSCLQQFINYCESINVDPVEISDDDLLIFMSSTKSEALLRQRIGTIQSFYNYVLGIPYKLSNYPYPKRHRDIPDFFTVSELNQIINSISNPKQRLIIKLQYVLALRVHEVVKIKSTDLIKTYNHSIDKYEYDLKIVGKGGSKDIIPVKIDIVNEIISVLGSNIFNSDEYLFKGQFGGHYSTRSVQIIINRAMEQCKIFKKGSTHLLRHSRATHLIQNGCSLKHIQELLRHKSSKTTELYLHLQNSDLRKAFDMADSLLIMELSKNETNFLLNE